MAKDSVVGLADYFNGTDKDFSKVGVKALDDYTLQYTLKQPEPYWNSKMTYSLFWPVNEEFLKSKGIALVNQQIHHLSFIMVHTSLSH